MADIIRDNLDFSAYLNMTDSSHNVRSTGAFLDDVIDYFHNGRGPSR